jgi:hypothetical protein
MRRWLVLALASQHHHHTKILKPEEIKSIIITFLRTRNMLNFRTQTRLGFIYSAYTAERFGNFF